MSVTVSIADKKDFEQLTTRGPLIDVCVVFDPCDRARVKPLFKLLQFNRQDGRMVSVYPPPPIKDEKGKKKIPETHRGYEQALTMSNAILLVLSDDACASMILEDGDKSEYFSYIRYAMERSKASQSMILPLFLSRVVTHEDRVGLVKFSCWAYKCKNQEVRAVMERVGSLQGLFVDPTDWKSKRHKLHSFWQETHSKLVPLSFNNFTKELDREQINNVIGGCCLGCCCGCCGFCLLCKRAKTRGGRFFRVGIVVGNAFCGILGVIVLIIVGSQLLNPLSCSEAPFSGDFSDEISWQRAECEESTDQVKSYMFLLGAIAGLWTLIMALCGYGCFSLGNSSKLKVEDEEEDEEAPPKKHDLVVNSGKADIVIDA